MRCAVFKYKVGNSELEKKQTFIDLTDVPPLMPILNLGRGSSSKYEGVNLNKSTNKWMAKIEINGRQHYIGTYDSEEEAAVDYARVMFKCNRKRKPLPPLLPLPRPREMEERHRRALA